MVARRVDGNQGPWLTPTRLAPVVDASPRETSSVPWTRRRTRWWTISFADPFTVRSWSGREIEEVPDLAGQLRLFSDQVIPELP
jgi:hypothetical protein